MLLELLETISPPKNLGKMSSTFTDYILVSTTREDKYLLMMPERVGNVWKFNVVESPGNLVADAIWHDGVETAPSTIEHLRISHRQGATKTFVGNVWRTGTYMSVPWNQCIYKYGFSNKNKCLPGEYHKVNTGKDITKRWHFEVGVMPMLVPVAPVLIPPVALPMAPVLVPAPALARQRAPAPPPAPARQRAPPSYQSIPTHVFHTFVETAIRNNENCPITMEALTRENVAAPPCGHLFTYDSLKQSIETSSVCPTCRANININQIQRW